MRACRCDGTGFVIATGDFKMRSGSVRKNTSIARRCPAYEDYFEQSPLMRDYPDKVPVRRDHGACKAAVQAHVAIFQKSEARRKDGKEL